MKSLRHILKDQQGAYFLLSAIVLSVMVAFAALGVEIGRWYGIQAEVSKSIDGAAFAGAKNVSNPLFADANGDPDDAALEAFVVQVAQANFPAGMLGTDTPVFTADLDAEGKVTVNGDVNSLNHLTTIMETGTPTTALGAVGAAKLRKAEIALVLDYSGSMDNPDPQPLVDLRDGATLFVNNFTSFQKDHRFALITFASGVKTPFPMDTDFVDPMNTEIANLTDSTGGTNAEDALAQARNLPWSPDQLTLPVNERTRQVVIFFSDGEPTSFRGTFTRNGVQYDATVPDGSVSLRKHNEYYDQISNYVAWPSGNGTGDSPRYCGGGGSSYKDVKWHIFSSLQYGLNSPVYPPLNGHGIHDCLTRSQLQPYVTAVSRQKAVDNAALLKGDGIEVYAIGLGAADRGIMQAIATDLDHEFFANTSGDLQGIFQEIANQLKLILVS